MWILGKIILILLGVVLGLLLLVLFFPVSYRIRGHKDSGQMEVTAGVSWLFGLLSCSYAYPEPGKLRIKLLGITIYRAKNQRAEDAPDAEKKEKKPKKEPKKTRKQDRESGINTSLIEDREDQTEKITETKTGGGGLLKKKKRGRKKEKETEKPEKKEKEMQGETIPEKIYYTFRRIYDMIKDILENISFYRELLEREETKALLRHCGRRLKNMGKALKPRKFSARCRVGFASPDTTGYFMAAYGVCQACLTKGLPIAVETDFEKQVLEGELQARGWLPLFCLIQQTGLVLLDKRLWKLYEILKNHGGQQRA